MPSKKRKTSKAPTSMKRERSTPGFKVGEHVRVKLGAPLAYRGQTGRIASVEGQSRFCVQLEEGVTSPLYSWWLERVEDE
jgi:hypothetical protein